MADPSFGTEGGGSFFARGPTAFVVALVARFNWFGVMSDMAQKG